MVGSIVGTMADARVNPGTRTQLTEKIGGRELSKK